MSRPSRDTVMLNIARELATRSTCSRRNVGCVLTDKHGRVLAMGHNGSAAGQLHCTDFACSGALLPSGTGLDACEAIHAEQNALMFCPDVMKIETCYVTASPCVSCAKMLMNTSCKTIVFLEEYPHEIAKQLWLKSNEDRAWRQHKQEERLDPV